MRTAIVLVLALLMFALGFFAYSAGLHIGDTAVAEWLLSAGLLFAAFTPATVRLLVRQIWSSTDRRTTDQIIMFLIILSGLILVLASVRISLAVGIGCGGFAGLYLFLKEREAILL